MNASLVVTRPGKKSKSKTFNEGCSFPKGSFSVFPRVVSKYFGGCHKLYPAGGLFHSVHQLFVASSTAVIKDRSSFILHFNDSSAPDHICNLSACVGGELSNAQACRHALLFKAHDCALTAVDF